MLVLPKGKNFISLNICQVKLPLEFSFLIFNGTSLQNFQNLCSLEHHLKKKKKPQQVYLLKPKLLRLQPSIVYLVIWPKHPLVHHLIYFPPALPNFIMFWIDSTFPTVFFNFSTKPSAPSPVNPEKPRSLSPPIQILPRPCESTKPDLP